MWARFEAGSVLLVLESDVSSPDAGTDAIFRAAGGALLKCFA